MAGTPMEGSQYGYWLAKQAGGLGSPAVNAAFTTYLGVTAGSVSSARTDGQERFPTYGGRFYSAVDWVDQIQGEGELTCAAYPSAAAVLAKRFLGTDAVSGSATPWTHSITAATSSEWVGLRKLVGVNEGTGAGAPRREQFNDGRITQLVYEASSANKMLRVTPTFLFAAPGVIATTTDPTATVEATRPFVYTDASSLLKFSTDTGTAVVITSTISFQLTLNDTLNPAPGDTITPIGYLPGESVATIAIECTANTESIQQFNRMIYGSSAPAVGAAPSSTLPASYGSVDIELSYGSSTSLRSFRFVIPSVKWGSTGEIPTNTDGSPVTLNFTGEARGTTNLVSVYAKNADSAAY